jgi:hypothetical protein
MNHSEASAEARRRWGLFARAEEPKAGCWDAMRGVCALYVKSLNVGSGSSWEDAFADADRRENRGEFDKAMRGQNDNHAKTRAEARANATACDVETMFAFGGTPYCRSHGVMGPCPYGTAVAK